MAFLDAELDRIGRPKLESVCAVLDTLAMARELHPGKKNSLDALCERYAIDHSKRTLHGALLDAQLLADVWLAMTRGQETLDIVMAASNAPAIPLGEAPAQRDAHRGARERRGARRASRDVRAHRAREQGPLPLDAASRCCPPETHEIAQVPPSVPRKLLAARLIALGAIPIAVFCAVYVLARAFLGIETVQNLGAHA